MIEDVPGLIIELRPMIRIAVVIFLAGSFARFSVAQSAPADSGKTTILRVCSGCHEADIATSQKHTREQWETVVGQMIDIGAPASDAEYTLIVDYLAKNYGPTPAKVNVNTASPKDLSDGLGLSAAESDALVAYRTKNGKFASVDDIKKVPGVEAAKIEAAKDRITF